MERDERHLDQEREREAQEDPLLRGVRQRQVLERREGKVDRRSVLRGGEHAGRDRGHQHEERSDERVHHELRRRPHPLARSPHPDQEVERDQHQVEEHDEERQVLGAEGPEHRALGQAEVQVVDPGAVPLAERGPHERRAEQDAGEHHEQDVQPVESELVVDPERGDPHLVGPELKAGVSKLEAREERDRHAERDEAPHRHGAADQARREQHAHHDRDRERQPDQDREGHRLTLTSSRSGSRGPRPTGTRSSRRRSSAGTPSGAGARRPSRRAPRRPSRS